MESQLLGFFQDRMATAYEEQTWAVALVSGMNAFIASNAELIRKGFKRWVLDIGNYSIKCVFRRIVTTHSAANCPPIPLDCDHPFRNIVTTHSAAL
jgi:hypothetical protein